MGTPVSLFDYDLPRERIAQGPAIPRESARLMVIDRKKDTRIHTTVSCLPDYLRRGDVLVINDSKVFRARLSGTLHTPDAAHRIVELFLVRPATGTAWIVLGNPGKRFKPGSTVTIGRDFSAVIVAKNPDGTMLADFGRSRTSVIGKANTYGQIPVPPYIKTLPKQGEYQTVYAKAYGSVAAPTAGFHLTAPLMERLKKRGVRIVRITLHVGLGTFMPIKTDTLEGHGMHAEWVQITKSVSEEILLAKKEHRRVIAVGTTSVRTLEGVAAANNGTLVPYSGDINLFILPGFRFRIVDGMLTNFHLPKSTLLVLVSAFAGRERMLRAYGEAIRNNYRFYSFGDAMLIT